MIASRLWPPLYMEEKYTRQEIEDTMRAGLRATYGAKKLNAGRFARAMRIYDETVREMKRCEMWEARDWCTPAGYDRNP